jgi:hypothetical protein
MPVRRNVACILGGGTLRVGFDTSIRSFIRDEARFRQ